MKPAHAPIRRSLASRLLAVGCGALLIGLFAAYFGLLIWAVFTIFHQLDRVLRGDWTGAQKVAAGLLVAVLVWFAIRIAWRLTLSILGLVTQRVDDGRWLDRNSAKLEDRGDLGAIVDRVSERVGSPQPDEIRISADQECYVLEERRFALRTQRRVILVMGMPQMLVLTVGEVQAILAHELAHFRSGDTTLTVFLFRLDETARINAEELQQQRWWMIDPVYWYFACFHKLFQWASAPWRRSHELLADEASAAAFGGEHAAQTLLRDWIVEWQFDAAVEEYTSDPPDGETIYEYFLQQWHKFTPESHEYLEKRLLELERPGWLAAQPTIGQRLAAMRKYPEMAPIDTRPAMDLISDAELQRIEERLSEMLTTQAGEAGLPESKAEAEA